MCIVTNILYYWHFSKNFDSDSLPQTMSPEPPLMSFINLFQWRTMAYVWFFNCRGGGWQIINYTQFSRLTILDFKNKVGWHFLSFLTDMKHKINSIKTFYIMDDKILFHFYFFHSNNFMHYWVRRLNIFEKNSTSVGSLYSLCCLQLIR